MSRNIDSVAAGRLAVSLQEEVSNVEALILLDLAFFIPGDVILVNRVFRTLKKIRDPIRAKEITNRLVQMEELVVRRGRPNPGVLENEKIWKKLSDPSQVSDDQFKQFVIAYHRKKGLKFVKDHWPDLFKKETSIVRNVWRAFLGDRISYKSRLKFLKFYYKRTGKFFNVDHKIVNVINDGAKIRNVDGSYLLRDEDLADLLQYFNKHSSHKRFTRNGRRIFIRASVARRKAINQFIRDQDFQRYRGSMDEIKDAELLHLVSFRNTATSPQRYVRKVLEGPLLNDEEVALFTQNFTRKIREYSDLKAFERLIEESKRISDSTRYQIIRSRHYWRPGAFRMRAEKILANADKFFLLLKRMRVLERGRTAMIKEQFRVGNVVSFKPYRYHQNLYQNMPEDLQGYAQEMLKVNQKHHKSYIEGSKKNFKNQAFDKKDINRAFRDARDKAIVRRKLIDACQLHPGVRRHAAGSFTKIAPWTSAVIFTGLENFIE